MIISNNNKAIIKKLVTRTLKANHKRNIFILIAIMLTTILITSFFSIGMSYLKTYKYQKIRIMGSTAHVVLKFPKAEQIEKIQKLEYIESIGRQHHVAKIINSREMKNMNLSLFYHDNEVWENHRKKAVIDIVGDYPTEYNEIMMSRWVLENMGINNPHIGMEIPITYKLDPENSNDTITEKFTLSCYYTGYLYIRAGNINAIYVSKNFAEKSGKSVENDGSVSIKLKNKTIFLRSIKTSH